MRRLSILVGVVVITLVAPQASAHTRSQSFSHWSTVDQTIDFSFMVNARRVTQLAQLYPPGTDLPTLLALHARETVLVYQGQESCALTLDPVPNAARTMLRITGHFECRHDLAAVPPRATVTAFQAVSPTHIHIARVTAGGEVSDVVLREGRSAFALHNTTRSHDFWGFITTGFLHVLSGLDHLVFLLAMILVAQTPRLAIFCITGFTLGHTLSLALATLGWIEPHEQLIEAMIGLTIAVTALESGVHAGLNRRNAMLAFAALIIFIVLVPLTRNYLALYLGTALAVYVAANGHFSKTQARVMLPVVTAVFGLIHGAGFAGGLKEVMLVNADIAVPLIGFNIGVELAQLVALSGIIALGWILSRTLANDLTMLRHIASLTVFALGCFWFAARLWA